MEEEQSLDEILARIAEQEASEALARQLEAEWNPPRTEASSSSAGSHSLGSASEHKVIVIEDDETENDEAMARRLAQEWGSEDTSNQAVASTSKPKNSQIQHVALDAPSSQEHNIPPDVFLLRYKPIFTRVNFCPVCEEKLEAPRGQVVFSASAPPAQSLNVVAYLMLFMSDNLLPRLFGADDM